MANNTPRVVRQSELPVTTLSSADATSGAYNVETIQVAETGQFGIWRLVDGRPYSVYIIPDVAGSLPSVVAQTYGSVAVNATGAVTSGTALIGSSADILYGQKANVTIANSAVAATLLNGVGTLTLPASRLAQGSTVRITLAGFMSDNVTALGSGTVAVKLGATTVASATGIAGLQLASREWRCEFLMQCQTAGATGKLIGQGYFEHTTNSDADLAWTRVPIKMTSQSGSIDLTASKAIDVQWTWDTADAGDTITCTNSLIELLG